MIAKHGISVVIPTYCGARRIARALQSLAAQSLSHELFEVIVVVNGIDDGVVAVVDNYRAQLNIRVEHLREKSVSRARNYAIGLAEFNYVVFIDDDDWVSEQYLEQLLNLATPNCLVLAPVVKVMDNSTLITNDNKFNDRLIKLQKIAIVIRFLTMNAGKIIPTWLLKKYKFSEQLRSSEDMALFSAMLASEKLAIRVVQDIRDAQYFRITRAKSLSRQEFSFDFAVAQRYQVIKAIWCNISDYRQLLNPLKALFLLSRMIGEVIYGVRIACRVFKQ